MPDHDSQPHDLDLVIDFVNTFDPDDDSDRLATPPEARDWLRERGLLRRTEVVSDADLRAAVRLREALRALLLENNGVPAARGAARELDLVASRGGLGVHFHAGGAVGLTADDNGFAGALASILIPIAEASSDGSWKRVKACRAPDCGWAFYDRSRNRSGVWCEMAVCGNRTKVRAYRARRETG